jgi:hydrogenase maturation protein HypF
MQSLQSKEESGIKAEAIRVSGTVQGVGFRPFVWRLAQQYKLRGRVWNDGEGVSIHVWGLQEALVAFREQLRLEAPPLTHIEGIFDSVLSDMNMPDDFSIAESQEGKTLTNISPDAAICPQCLAEIHDPADRRYRYPFTTCTHCGPRLSIIKGIPYDRANTSMQVFTMCPECQAEYDNPADRRFHAQPNACKTCGPSLWLENVLGERVFHDGSLDDIDHAAKLIKQGYILAIKGIGGFNLACDAANANVLDKLRERKRRYHKPFALMARDIGVIRRYAEVNDQETELLQNPAAPIVILRVKTESNLSEAVAPGQNSLGFMLPYTPLHALLLQSFDVPLVMTSGNRSDEAQCITNDQVREQLHGIADFFLLHNRDIVNRLDDSVARIIDGQPQLLRRARGYAPSPLRLPKGFEDGRAILAMGAELKNSFCLVKENRATVSQYQGDLEDTSVFKDYRNNIELYERLYDHRPDLIAVDEHPEYISSKYAKDLAATQKLPLVKVQHHHAHIAACMVEHGLPLDNRPVLGVALDGLGYSEDSGKGGELRGSEFLLADYSGFQRLACFQSIAMPGGSRAIMEPWRNTFAHLHQCLGWEQVRRQFPYLAFVKYMRHKPISNLLTMLEKGINSPQASSAGRLFDAVAALLGVCRDGVSYEGQAAIQLEAKAETGFVTGKPYPYTVRHDRESNKLRIEWRSFWQAVLLDAANGISVESIAGRFHQTLVQVIIDLVRRLLQQHDFTHVVLSGGVMQNQLLLDQVTRALSRLSISYLIPRQFPANDGGIALGQAAVAIARSQGR